MTKKELVEKFKNEMPEFSGTDEEKEIKTALYIYIELSKMKSFDERYFFGNSKKVRQVEKEAVYDSENPDVMVKKKKILCITMSHLYKAILADFGIDSTIITEMTDRNTIEHMTNVINLKSGKKILADAQLDMYRIQTGMSLHHFGSESEFDTDIIGNDELDNMLIEIGYINSKDDYRDDKVETVRRKIEGLSIEEAVETILNSPEIYEGVRIGIVEAYKYYYSTLKTLMPDVVGKNIYQFVCSKNESGQKDPSYSFGIYTTDRSRMDNIQIYLYSKKEERLLKCDLEKLVELENKGLRIGRNNGEKATKILKKAIKLYRRQKEIGDEQK